MTPGMIILQLLLTCLWFTGESAIESYRDHTDFLKNRAFFTKPKFRSSFTTKKSNTANVLADSNVAMEKIAPKKGKTCNDEFRTYYGSLRIWNLESYPQGAVRVRLEIRVEDKKEYKEWGESLTHKDAYGYESCYRENKTESGLTVKYGPCASEFNSSVCAHKYLYNKYYPACCELPEAGSSPRCYCECIFFCESRENIVRHLDQNIPTEFFEECKTDHSTMAQGKAWKKKKCEETKNTEKVQRLKKLCENNPDDPDDYGRCVSTGYCLGNVCKQCYRWQCASELTDRVRHLEKLEKKCRKDHKHKRAKIRACYKRVRKEVENTHKRL